MMAIFFTSTGSSHFFIATQNRIVTWKKKLKNLPLHYITCQKGSITSEWNAQGEHRLCARPAPHMKLISMFSICLFLVRSFFTSFVKFFTIFFLLHPNACGICFNAVDQLHARTTVCPSTFFSVTCIGCLSSLFSCRFACVQLVEAGFLLPAVYIERGADSTAERRRN